MIRAIVAGAQAGWAVASSHMIRQSNDVECAPLSSGRSQSVGSDVGQVQGSEPRDQGAGSLEEVIGLGEVIIDFSAPEADAGKPKARSTAHIGAWSSNHRHEGSLLDQVKAFAGVRGASYPPT